MKTAFRFYLPLAIVLVLGVVSKAAEPKMVQHERSPQTSTYVIVNEDQGFPYSNEISIYLAGGTDDAPMLTLQSVVDTGGFGSFGGFFATQRLNSVANVAAKCLYVSNSGDNTIASVSLETQQLVGVFSGSATDDGYPNGIGLAVSDNFLYASYTSSNSIGVFATNPGCGLTFLQDVPAVGLHGGSVTGMALNGALLAVAYGDGSIQSFNIADGIPVSNDDLQNSSGFAGPLSSSEFTPGNLPSGVDVTRDGSFAIFGDIASSTVIEVARVSGGKLQHTMPYNVGVGTDAGSLRLSPDEKLLYIVNNESGTVTAAFFDAKSGTVVQGCTSPTLRGFNGRPWFGSLAIRDTSGTGSVLYVAEFGRKVEDHSPDSAIGILTIAVNGNTCTLSESLNSPEMLNFPGTLSIGAFPPRPF